ncbi:LuxR C-terminal-related transcriptional regulator [Streptomyces durbertensis]|uniref:LuxR C-terminal-related transcriptional regulator n=1 Tax=Streptomyces durbertensis TaxID=2448886 RepID=UPI001E2EB4F9|nr:response regulator transcription factor [Streptomyces durbertensis]
MTTVLVVHEVELWRKALSSLLGTDDGLRAVAVAREDVLPRTTAEKPDVIVVDLDCPGSMGLLEEVDSARRAARCGGRLVVLARADRPGVLRNAAATEASGYVDKYGAKEELPAVVRKVAAGGRYIDESLAFGLLRAKEIPLSGRELGVLSLAAQGDSVAAIACRLSLTRGTVRNYLAAAVRKAGARNRTHAIRLATEAGWI